MQLCQIKSNRSLSKSLNSIPSCRLTTSIYLCLALSVCLSVSLSVSLRIMHIKRPFFLLLSWLHCHSIAGQDTSNPSNLTLPHSSLLLTRLPRARHAISSSFPPPLYSLIIAYFVSPSLFVFFLPQSSVRSLLCVLR